MENKKQSAFASAVSPGIIISAALILFSLVMFLLDVPFYSYWNYLSFLILFVGIVWSIFSYRNKIDGNFISYGKAFSVGFYTGLILSVPVAIFTFFYVLKINPNIVEDMLIYAEDEIISQVPDISDEDLAKITSFYEKIYTPLGLAIITLIADVVASTIFSLIIAIFAKREKKEEISAE